MRILWLYGPPAVGKSVTAWEVLNALAVLDPATGLVDIDQLGMSSPDEDDDPGGHRLKGHALAALAGEFASSGVRTLVVSGVVGHELMEFYAEVLDVFSPLFVRLNVPGEVLRRRLVSRGAYAEDWLGVERQARSLENADLDHHVVAAGSGTPAEVAMRVLREVGAALDDAEPEAPRIGRGLLGGGGGRAIILGGTRAVGKSTIGWQTFMAARASAHATGFVDLRQLGLLGTDGGAVNHALQARAASAVWRVFREHGAQLLIMNGPVNTSEELRTYRAALAGTPLAATRLIADRQALSERVQARLRGEMVPLAGDSLVGRPTEDAPAIVDVAVRLQEMTPADSHFPVLDTTTLRPEEAAQQLLATTEHPR